MPAPLYLISTPIGNLEDITLRALRVLREASLIAAEDTRHTRHLLNHFEIRTPAVSYHEHSSPGRQQEILERLMGGESVALVTDAGTPGVSDPGFELVREAVERGIPVIPIPGPSALLAALCASGLPTDRFVFEGFLPRKGAPRARALARLREQSGTLILYEAPHRLLKTLRDLLRELGDRQVVVAREITKIHEEFWRGSLAGAIDRWSGPVRGELVLVIAGASESTPPDRAERATASGWCDGVQGSAPLAQIEQEERLPAALAAGLAAGKSLRDAAHAAAQATGRPYRELYRLALKERKTQDAELCCAQNRVR